MNHRTTQLLLAAVAILLLVHLIRTVPSASPAQADEPAAAQPVVRAQAFELVNAQGDVVAQLHVGPDGGGNIRLRSGDGMVRVKLGASADGSGLILFDTEAEPSVHLAVNKSGASATLAEKGKPPKILQP